LWNFLLSWEVPPPYSILPIQQWRHAWWQLREHTSCVSVKVIFHFALTQCTAKMALTAKMCELHLLPKWRPTRIHKKSRTQFWLSDSSGIIYHLWRGGRCEKFKR
jgi:hypothetical protein